MEKTLNATPNAGGQRKSSRYPQPLVVPPALEHVHRQSFIILHGRGSNATTFGPVLLDTEILASASIKFKTLRDAFPHAKFVFPTASKRRATIYKRTPINQWFDNWSLEHPNDREELQFEGLRESSQYIHGLLREEIDAVGAQNVVLGGLSQGCAASLVALLTWDGPPLAAAVGMCGWLPLRRLLESRATGQSIDGDPDDELSDDLEDEDNPFATDDDNDQTENPRLEPFQHAIASLHEELDMVYDSSSSIPLQSTKVFLGHGTEDDRVSLTLGQEATRCLRALRGNVQWHEYSGLGHWYSGEMLQDLVGFLQGVLTVEEKPPSVAMSKE